MTSDALERQLAGWLAATDITWLELRGPGVHLRLHHDGTQVQAVPAGAGFPHASGKTVETMPVRAPSVGVFLHAHPLHEKPLVAPGEAVSAGQVLGLLRIGALLLPVASPGAGTFAGHAVEDSGTVGYGAVLAHLSPDSPARPG